MKRAIVLLCCLISVLCVVSCGGGTKYGIRELADVMEKANKGMEEIKSADDLANLTTNLKNELISLEPKLNRLKADYPGFFSGKPDVNFLPEGVSAEDLNKLLKEVETFNSYSTTQRLEWANDSVVLKATEEFKKVYHEIFR